ncbi:transmembrane protein 70, mitochondrial, partial [Brachyhypopomus gauderio]|uniref:transmembrane protein 70, mitochondrial n=1 Tax=Brachyhypopomus gauderio TaxID=698409 RepID=UPI0040428E40
TVTHTISTKTKHFDKYICIRASVKSSECQGPHTCAPTLAPQVKTLWPAQRALSKETRTTSGRCYSAQSTSPEDGILIYTGNLGKTVLGVKFFSYSSSMFSLCVMPYIMMKNGMGVSSFTMKVAFCGVIGFFTFITPVLLHLITKGYVVRLYHNKETDTYTAVTYSAFLTQKKTVFHQSDVRIPDVSSMFTSFYVKKQSMLLNPMLFDLPHDYNHLMGYDQPFSFDMEEVNKPDKN